MPRKETIGCSRSQSLRRRAPGPGRLGGGGTLAGRRKGGLGGDGNAAARRPSGSAEVCAEVALSEVLKPPGGHPSSASAGPPAGAGKAPSARALARAFPDTSMRPAALSLAGLAPGSTPGDLGHSDFPQRHRRACPPGWMGGASCPRGWRKGAHRLPGLERGSRKSGRGNEGRTGLRAMSRFLSP